MAKKIRLIGEATLKVPFDITVGMSEEQFDALPGRKQNDLVDNTVDWASAMSQATFDDADIDEVYEIEDAEGDDE